MTEPAAGGDRRPGGSSADANDPLAALGVTAHQLVNAFVLDRDQRTRDRLRDRVQPLYGPGDLLFDGLRGGDLLVRTAVGEGMAAAGILVDGVLHSTDEARRLGWQLESALPGRYALVRPIGPEDGIDTVCARRIADRDGYLLAGQALVRAVGAPLNSANVEDVITEGEPGATGLQSQRFGGDNDLDSVAAGAVRLAAPGTSPYPAPVTSSGPAVQKVQQALIDLGYPLHVHGADGQFGDETGRAVSRYKTDRGITPTDPVVGPQTIRSLDRDVVAHDGPAPPPPPTPTPPAPPTPPPDPDAGIRRWITAMGPGMRAGNTVRPLIDGPDTLAAYQSAISTATSNGHFIYLLGWWLDLDVPLEPTAQTRYCLGPKPTAPEPSSLRALLRAASSRGVQIRAVLWDQSLSAQNTAEVGFINSLPSGAALLDNHQLDYYFGSQHQKVVIVNGSEGLQAFCGGIDINRDRICPKAPQSGSGGAGAPLHDVHCRITGPAADDLLRVFVKRWYANPRHQTLDGAKGPLTGICQPPSSATGTSWVRIGETFNATVHLPAAATKCTSPPPELPATKFRDRDVQKIYLTAIDGARRFIYWEDQYMVNMCAAEALRRALPRVEFIILLMPDSHISDLPQRWYRRKRFIEHICSHPQGPAKLHVFILYDPVAKSAAGAHTYVHAKTLMVDDELAIIGSANCNRRGWESDTEVVAAITGGATVAGTPPAKSLRQRLWAEHLGVSVPVVDDPVLSAPLWWMPPDPTGSIALASGAVVPVPMRRVVPYNVDGGTDSWPQPPWDRYVDPPMPAPGAPCAALTIPAPVSSPVRELPTAAKIPFAVG